MTIETTIEDIIFQNKENGYTVCTAYYEGEELSLVGMMLGLKAGEEVKVTGEFVTHPIYGRQLKVMAIERSMPSTVQGMEKYLASGIIKGIGAKTAKKIVKHFGKDTFKVIEEEPLRLSEISGITKKKALAISEAFHSQYALREVMLFLQKYGITTTFAVKIFEKYKEQTIAIVKNTPYRLAEDITGIGFKKADEVAYQLGIDRNDPERIKSGILYVLGQFSNNGHTYMPKQRLMSEAIALLDPEYYHECEMMGEMASPLVEDALMELAMNRQIMIKTYDEQICIFLAIFYYTEQLVAKRLIDLSIIYQSEIKDIDKELKQTQKELGITLVEEQIEAIHSVLTNGVTVITGGPGTGKTTTICAILHMLNKAGEIVLLAAPTGRAAKRMTEQTGEEAMTIHRLLEIGHIQEGRYRQFFNRNEDNPLEADVIIIDEMSMVDILLMNALLSAMSVGQRLILIGDADQLPSVGAGNVLRDIISSERIPVVRLRQIFRQAAQSAIVMNAHKINKGEYPIVNEKNTDFFFMIRTSKERIYETIIELITARLPKYQGFDSLHEIQVLSPMRKGDLGVTNLNKVLQLALNPPHTLKSEKEYRNIIFREGDKVMQIKNNYNMRWEVKGRSGLAIEEGTGVYNGDCGLISLIKEDSLIVTFDDGKVAEYDMSHLEELELAYAVTIHKSQGSEYPVIILPLFSGPSLLFSRNLLYTAVTRAKKMVIIIGLIEKMHQMVDNNRELERYSSLDRNLKTII